MTETKRQIKELKEALPYIREKVIAVAVLLALSLTMMASVSYAWYTMSLAPEVSSITTQVSSNGNLEVALAGLYDKNGNLIAPLASAIGDSFSADGQTTQKANLTWGNLINLSGNYGIESLVLRPAILAEGSKDLLSSIYYGEDGRYDSENVDFGFTSWKEVDGKYTFAVTDGGNYGVRAISTVTYPDGKSVMQEKLDQADGLYNSSVNAYARIVEDDVKNNKYLQVIQSLVEVYVDAQMGDNGDETNCTDYIDALYEMMHDLHHNVVAKYGEALAAMANAQLSLITNEYTAYTLETLVAAGSNNELKKNGVNLGNSYQTFRDVYTGTQSDMLALEEMKNNKATTPVLWKHLEPIVDRLIAINSILINDMTMSEFKSLVKNNITNIPKLLEILGQFRNSVVVVKGGFLRDIELLCGPQMCAHISFRALGLITVNAEVKTNLRGATYTTYYNLDKIASEEMAESGDLEYTGTMIAGDTYGMVIDLWVRTNAANSLLMLDGLVSTTTRYELRKVVLGGDSESRQVFAYTYSVTQLIEGVPLEQEVVQYLYQDPEEGAVAHIYKMTLNGEEVEIPVYEGGFYDVTTGFPAYIMDESGEATEELLDYNDVITDETVLPALDAYEIVTGFNGSNRVDDDYNTLTGSGEMSATQGSGSCYIFYASTPEEYASSVELLKHLKVAFVDFNGAVLAKAGLDVEHIFEDNGKYVVPLFISSSDCADEEGNYGITTMQQNEAMFISAVVYLDGEELENSMVMEKGSIQGSLNLQFASSADQMEPLDDSDLSMKTVSLSASISKSQFEYTGSAQSARLTTTVSGLEPKTVQAFFVRMFNATQGAQMEAVDLEFVEGTGWVGDPQFTMPGTYILNGLLIDGVEYALPESIVVTVEGLRIERISFCVAGDNLALTADNYTTRPISVSIDADDASRPSEVSVRFESTDESVNKKFVTARLTYDSASDTWNGTVRFTSSGNYKLTYLVMDGSYTNVEEDYNLTFSAYLGLRTNIYMSSDVGLSFPFEGVQEIRVLAEIITDTDVPLRNMDNVKLSYEKLGDSILENGLNTGMDWNGSYYEGTFRVEYVGTYSFAQLLVGSNVITVANTAPGVSAYAKEPPAYVFGSLENNTNIVVTSDDGTLYYKVTMRNVAGAKAFTAVFKDPSNTHRSITVGDQAGNAEGDGYRVNNDDGSTTVFFVIPDTNGRDHKGGEWVLEEIRIDGVIDADGNFYGTTDDPEFEVYKPFYPLDIADETFAVVDTVGVELKLDAPVTVGNQTDTTFMSEQTVNAMIPVEITTGGVDLGKYSLGVKSVTITLRYAGGSNTNGFYTYTGTNDYEERGEYTLVYDAATGNWYLPANTATVFLAGNYTYSVDVTLDHVDDIADSTTNTFAEVLFTDRTDSKTVLNVYSAKPTMTISGVSTNPSNARYYTTATPSSTSGMLTGSFNSKIDEFNAAVYMYVTSASGSASVTIKYPSVTLGLSGVPTTHENVTVAFDGSTPITFAAGSMTANGNIGKGTDGSYNNGFIGIGAGVETWPIFYPAGKQTVNEIEVTLGGVVFKVKLSDDVTINNPMCPVYADFVINNSTFPDSVPGRIYSENGVDITITLPDADNIRTSWTEAKSETVRNTLDSSTTNKTVYEIWSSTDCDGTTYQHQEYTKTVTVTSGEGSETTWTRTWSITGWMVGDTPYGLGETITVTSNQTITAIISYTDSVRVTEEYTFTRTETYYTAGTNNIPGMPEEPDYEEVEGSYADSHSQSNPIVEEQIVPKN